MDNLLKTDYFLPCNAKESYMPKVNIQSETNLSAQEAYEKVKDLLNNDAGLKKLDPKYACDFDDASLSGNANGKMFKAAMKVSEKGSGSSVEIIVDLPLKFALAKGMVKSTLEKKLIKILG